MSTTKDVTIKSGSDEGKTFVVKKMGLLQGDSWANRVALALCKSGVDISGLTTHDEKGNVVFRGMLDMVGVVPIALKALGGVEEDKALGLLAELTQGVKIRLPDGSERSVVMESDITSISTLWDIMIESLKVNLDFLIAGVTQ